MVSREKCLEWAEPIYGKGFWQDAALRRMEQLVNKAYAEGQKDMREQAAMVCEAYDPNSSEELYVQDKIRALEIE